MSYINMNPFNYNYIVEQDTGTGDFWKDPVVAYLDSILKSARGGRISLLEMSNHANVVAMRLGQKLGFDKSTLTRAGTNINFDIGVGRTVDSVNVNVALAKLDTKGILRLDISATYVMDDEDGTVQKFNWAIERSADGLVTRVKGTSSKLPAPGKVTFAHLVMAIQRFSSQYI